MIVLAAIDVEHFILPDRITYTGIIVGLLLQLWPGLTWTTPAQALIGALLGAGILLLVASLWYLLRGVAGMGLGDVKMLAMIGAVLGWPAVLITLFFSTLTGSLVGVVGMVGGRMDAQSRIPFGLFLSLGGLLALFFGPSLLSAYLGLMPGPGP